MIEENSMSQMRKNNLGKILDSNKRENLEESEIDEIKLKLKACKHIDVRNLKPNEIDNIEDFKIDTSKPSTDRVIDFLSKTKNPYAFNVDGFIVKIDFADNGENFEDCVENAISDSLK